MNLQQTRIGRIINGVFGAVQVTAYVVTFGLCANYVLLDNSGVALVSAFVMVVVSAILMGLDHLVNANGNR